MEFVKTHGRSPCPVQLSRTAPHLQAHRPLTDCHSVPYASLLPCQCVRPSAGVCAPCREPPSSAHGTQRIHLLRPPTLPRFPWMVSSGTVCVRPQAYAHHAESLLRRHTARSASTCCARPPCHVFRGCVRVAWCASVHSRRRTMPRASFVGTRHAAPAPAPPTHPATFSVDDTDDKIICIC